MGALSPRASTDRKGPADEFSVQCKNVSVFNTFYRSDNGFKIVQCELGVPHCTYYELRLVRLILKDKSGECATQKILLNIIGVKTRGTYVRHELCISNESSW